MKRVIKRAVSFVLVFMTVFSVFTILPSEVFHTAYVKAAEMFSSETGASTQETYTTDDFTYTLIDEYSKVQILSYIGSDTDVVIPDRIDNKKVTSIADSACIIGTVSSVTVTRECIRTDTLKAVRKFYAFKRFINHKSTVSYSLNRTLRKIEFVK